MSCRLCGNKHKNLVFSAKNMRSSEKERFDYVECSLCGSVSIKEIPDNLAQFYEGYYSFGPVIDKHSFFLSIARKYLIKGYRLPRLILNTSVDLALHAIADSGVGFNDKILDVGCGTGQLVSDLKSLGFSNVEGLDPYLESDIFHRNGAVVRKKKFTEEDGTWDLIMLHHVFEHLENQEEILSHAAKLLSPSGKILLRIPNVDSYAYRKYKGAWYGMQAPVVMTPKN